MGTERILTSYSGASAGQYSNLPFGDGQTTMSGSDLDPYHFAMLDYDSETTTDHAQYRQYNPTQGRWMRPDPYAGSYDFSNPQSFNRYAYVLNNPLAYVDATGLDCAYFDEDDDGAPSDIEPGDCPTDINGIPTDNGYYIDASGATNAWLDNNGNLMGYSIGDQSYTADGNPDYVQYSLEMSDSTKNFLATINTMYQSNLFDVGNLPNLNVIEPRSAPNKPQQLQPQQLQPQQLYPQNKQRQGFSSTSCFYLDWGMSYIGGLSAFTAIQPEASVVSVPLGFAALGGWGIGKVGGC
ncbi:RHS repeat protein [Acidicapsa dinghuensis]|nr:RHS repeat-associated core domain-containing protein [Acidicapsa dinghuensis]